MKDLLKSKANVKIELFDQLGKLKEKREIHNTMTTAGKNGVAALVSSGSTRPNWIAVGTGSPAATLLGAEVVRIAVSSNTTTGAVTTIVATFGAGVGTATLTEAGLFDVVTANTVNMWADTTFTAIVKGSIDVLQITWTITQS